MYLEYFLFWFILNCEIYCSNAVGKTSSDLNSSCNQPDCLRCDLDSNECAKCLHVMMVPTRTCQEKCPHGYDPIWAEQDDIFGRICQERSVLAMVSYREVGIIAGVSVLGAIGVGIFLGVLLLRNKVKVPPDSPPRGLPKLLQDKRPKTVEVVIKGKERAEFVARLRHLRKEAPYIVRMVTSTRNRFRSRNTFGHEAPSDAKTKACKAVVRDLSRVLCLLSLKEEYIQTAPKDWRSLLSWTERLLARYKRQEGLKERTEDGTFAFRGGQGQGHVRLNKSLFITREQQLKADKDKRRLEQDDSFFPDVGGEDDNNKSSTSVHTEQNKINTKDVSQNWENEDQVNPKENSCQEKKKPSKHINFLNLNKTLWFKFLFGKTTENDLEKGDADVTKMSNENDDDFTFDDDDIPSQTFFDHIEAFAFDIDDDIHGSNQSSPELNTNRVENPDNNDDGEILSRNNYKNNLNLFKTYQNRHLKPSERDPYVSRYNSRVKKHSFDKPNRVSRLRRISSSFLGKDKRLLRLKQEFSKTKKRRPLKRQKHVEKETHSKIIEKYHKGKHSDEEEQNETNTTDTGVTSPPTPPSDQNSDDDFVSIINSCYSNPLRIETAGRNQEIILTPPPSSNSSSEGYDTPVENMNHIQKFDHSDINIIHGPSYQKQFLNQNVYKNTWDTRQANRCYSRCEILTNV